MPIYKGKPTKDGRIYYFRIRYKDIFGKSNEYTSKKYKTKEECKQDEAKFILTKQSSTKSSVTLDNVFNEYIVERKNQVKITTITRDTTAYKLLDPLKNVRINEFDLPTYKKYIVYLEGLNLSVRTKNKTLQLLKRLLEYSSLYHNTKTDIIRFIKPFRDNSLKKEMQFYTYEEYLKFSSVITDLEHQVFFDILYYCGLRLGEILALTWSDISFQKKEVSITKTLTNKIKGQKWSVTTPKTKNSTRILPLTEKVLNGLILMKNKVSNNNDNLDNKFIFGYVVPYKETTIKRFKDKYIKESNSKYIRIHDFRHSCASLLINKGASITLVSKYLGHSNIATTLNTYTHLYKSELNEMVDILNNL